MSSHATAPPRRPSVPVLTERLIIRPHRPAADADVVHVFRPAPEATAPARSHPRPEGDVVALTVILRDTGARIGHIVLAWDDEADRVREVGHVLHPDHRGKGYATEALRALLGEALGDSDRLRVAAQVHIRAPGSPAWVSHALRATQDPALPSR